MLVYVSGCFVLLAVFALYAYVDGPDDQGSQDNSTSVKEWLQVSVAFCRRKCGCGGGETGVAKRKKKESDKNRVWVSRTPSLKVYLRAGIRGVVEQPDKVCAPCVRRWFRMPW